MMKAILTLKSNIRAFVAVIFILACGSPQPSQAGDEVPTVDSKSVTVDPESTSPEFESTFILPGWLMGLEGTVGAQGLETGIDAGFDDLIKNLDMIAAGTLEVRRGKFGFILDGLYAKLSVGGTPPGPLLSSVSVDVEQVLAEGILTYRFFESERGWLEFLAGARYMYVGNQINFAVDSAGVQTASREISAMIVDKTTSAVQQEVSKQLPSLLRSIQQQVNASVKNQATNAAADMQDRLTAQVGQVQDIIRDHVLGGIGLPSRESHSDNRGYELPAAGQQIANSNRVREAIKDYISAKTEAIIAAELAARKQGLQAQARNQLAAAQSKANSKLEKAEAHLAKTIEKEINDKLPDSPVSASKSWVDPFFGFRGRYLLCDKWYLAARGDIGGFGISSQLTWNAYAGLGVDINERIAMELGYRYLSIDYRNSGFVYDIVTKGPFIGVRIAF